MTSIPERVIELARSFPELPAHNLQFIIEECGANETILAHEILLDQLYEYDIPITQDQLRELYELASLLDITGRHYWPTPPENSGHLCEK